MDAFLSLLLSPPIGVKPRYWEYPSRSYCLTSKHYVIFPREVEENGKSITRFLPCEGLIIDTHTKETYEAYEKIIEAYLETTSDPIKVNWFGPKTVTVKISKPEHEGDVRKANEARVKHQALVDSLEKAFHVDLEKLGADAYIEGGVYISNWPSECQLKDEWFDVRQEPNYEKCQINLTFHSETELYKVLGQYKDKLKYKPPVGLSEDLGN